ncbi:sigma-70 family RNA polymerase sigma factor [Erythrobacter sp.]|jgi:RNA polymerase sigma factor for flagellar operon FliA|uniref:sigma-70 family RNA polymerase sigma factor n=1 Tax=Erythrobacter sp. TaxID=1042 RepID=UPI002ECC29C2|nr:sigma-70 family RNA polymerase sigma factor [Erythrobacter sp.]
MKQDHAAFTAPYASASRADVEDRIARFLPLVRRAAWHIYGDGRHAAGLEVEDLIQVGLVALTECTQRHARPGEDGFAAYAKIRVRGAMVDCLRKLAEDTRNSRRKRAQLAQTVETLRAQSGAEPSRTDIARAMQVSEDELFAIESSGISVTSISEEYDETDTAFASDDPDPFEQLCSSEDRERLVLALAKMPERLQLVMQLFFVEEMNLTEIAAVLEVSVPRVHQLRAKALKDLRGLLEVAD